MTAIIGVRDGSDVWMGADSFSGNSEYLMSVGRPKITRREVAQVTEKDNLPDGVDVMLVGTAGDWRPSFLLSQLKLPPHHRGEDAFVYISSKLADCLRDLHREKGYLQKTAEREGGNCHVLIGYQGRLFSMWDEFQVVENAEPYMAIGSGMYIALGALATTEGIDPLRRLEMVLEITEHHHPYLNRPFHFEHVGNNHE
jgi:hypothetical protein